MSTRNISFYEDLTKISFNYIIKYAPYLFFCFNTNTHVYKHHLNCLPYMPTNKMNAHFQDINVICVEAK